MSIHSDEQYMIWKLINIIWGLIFCTHLPGSETCWTPPFSLAVEMPISGITCLEIGSSRAVYTIWPYPVSFPFFPLMRRRIPSHHYCTVEVRSSFQTAWLFLCGMEGPLWLRPQGTKCLRPVLGLSLEYTHIGHWYWNMGRVKETFLYLLSLC